MTETEKAARMALEALEELQGVCTDSPGGVEAVTIWTPDAIAALTQALATTEPKLHDTLLRVEDVKVDVLTKQVGGFAPIMSSGVRLTHVPSGISVTVDTARSQHANRRLAWERLAKLVATTEQAASICDGFAAPDMAAALRGKPATTEPLTWAPLKQSADGRAAVLKFFMFKLKRHDFLDYITNTLAADFACVLGGYLQAINTAATPEPTPASPADMQVYDKIAAGYWTERKGEPVGPGGAFLGYTYQGEIDCSKEPGRSGAFWSCAPDDHDKAIPVYAYTSPQVPEDHPLMVFAIECEMGALQEHEVPLRARKALDAARKGE